MANCRCSADAPTPIFRSMDVPQRNNRNGRQRSVGVWRGGTNSVLPKRSPNQATTTGPTRPHPRAHLLGLKRQRSDFGMKSRIFFPLRRPRIASGKTLTESGGLRSHRCSSRCSMASSATVTSGPGPLFPTGYLLMSSKCVTCCSAPSIGCTQTSLRSRTLTSTARRHSKRPIT